MAVIQTMSIPSIRQFGLLMSIPSIRKLCAVGAIVIVILGGAVTVHEIELPDHNKASVSDVVLGAPHDEVRHRSGDWPIQATNELTITSSPTSGSWESFFKLPPAADQ